MLQSHWCPPSPLPSLRIWATTRPAPTAARQLVGLLGDRLLGDGLGPPSHPPSPTSIPGPGGRGVAGREGWVPTTAWPYCHGGDAIPGTPTASPHSAVGEGPSLGPPVPDPAVLGVGHHPWDPQCLIPVLCQGGGYTGPGVPQCPPCHQPWAPPISSPSVCRCGGVWHSSQPSPSPCPSHSSVLC